MNIRARKYPHLSKLDMRNSKALANTLLKTLQAVKKAFSSADSGINTRDDSTPKGNGTVAITVPLR